MQFGQSHADNRVYNVNLEEMYSYEGKLLIHY